MAIEATDYTSALASDYSLPQVSGKTIDKDGFYKLLLAEIQNQDPTAPVDNKDMILQLAQFSSIESTQTLNGNMNDFVDKTSLATATSLIGKEVVYLDSETSTNYTGTVSSVQKSDSGYSVVVDGYTVDLSMVREVSTPSVSTSTNQ